ncbi:enoyl-CoA hydratase/isomerase family protein [Candidatus Desantisbacteria bacterium]|nr:enoyl-CoA hydratase/isomerase family protein [Candidatus Desantisbacteria bacterium]
MKYNTILVKESLGVITVTFNRLSQRNSINRAFIKELNEVLDKAEQDTQCRIVILEGQNDVFCTGMDFEEAAMFNVQDKKDDSMSFLSQYMKAIKRFTLTPKVIISKIEGQVMAGGVGLAAASDLVIATPRVQISLSEALWGLLPAMVLPYLIRRVGYQKAYSMTLTTLPISAQEAFDIHLVDEVSEEPDRSIQYLSQRLFRLEQSTIKNIKSYFRSMWLITDEMEKGAISESFQMMSDPKVRENIENYVKYKKFPWDDRK